MAEIKIDKEIFQERLSHFVSAWKADKRAGDAQFNGVSSVVVLTGKTEETAQFQKNNAVHFWLLGYEFPATLFLFTLEALYIVTTAQKAKHLEPLKGGKHPLEILVRGKDAEQNEQLFVKITDIIKSAGKKVGVLPKDSSTGPFVEGWKKAYHGISKDVEEADISLAFSAALAVKDENELRAMRNASKACIALMNPYFVEEMSNILDEEKKVKHSVLANRVDGKLDDTKFWTTVELPNKQKMPAEFDPALLDWTHGPIIQSGGKFDLKMNAQVDDEVLHAGVIMASMGLRYKSYCSLIARTYLVDPNKSQESNYKLLLNVHRLVLREVRDGATAKDIYAKAIGHVRSKRPELEKHFLKSVGSGIGIETRDNTLLLSGKNSRSLKDGMTLCITTGFNNIENPNPQDKKSKVYSIILTDTVRVTTSEPVIFTGDAPSDLDATSFFFKDDEEPQPSEAPKKAKKDSTVGAVATKNITKTKLRAERSTNVDEGAEAKRREHQKELAKKKQEEGMKRFAEALGDQNGTSVKKFKRFESYKRDNQFPTKTKDLSILVDYKNSTVILPIMGRPVPFHIQTIKNASKNDEGEFAYLRVNFLSPGQGVGRKDDQPFEDVSAHFVRSLTFRSHDGERLQDIVNQIANMKKDVVKREQEKKDMEDVVEQDKLVEIRNRRPNVMDNIYLRPAMDGKRVPGKVEIHQNGLRYQSPVNTLHRVDILFSNVKHLFFQPCQHEMVVLIHVHLKDPILVGKKKTRDVQFYREATDIQFDETGNRKRKYRYGDEEEFEAEQEERRRRADLDRHFKAFAEKIAEAGKHENVDVDVPFREVGFSGVPFRSNVFCQPSADCLVQLTEPPFMVVTIEEIEIAHLERVQFGLKNFDLVFVFKDFHRAPYHINTIPVESLENVKEWLDSVNIPYSEGPLNLNWPTIMKTVTADTHLFFADGGWSFLAGDSGSEDGDEESEESAFEMSDSELAASEESSEEDSDFDSNASADASEDASEDEDASEGEDWDELEKKAKRKDMDGSLSADDAPKKKRKH